MVQTWLALVHGMKVVVVLEVQEIVLEVPVES